MLGSDVVGDSVGLDVVGLDVTGLPVGLQLLAMHAVVSTWDVIHFPLWFPGPVLGRQSEF